MLAWTRSTETVHWKWLLFTAGASCIGLASLIVYTPYAIFIYIFLLAPAVFITFLILLVIDAIHGKYREGVSLFLSTVIFFAISIVGFHYQEPFRDHVRWVVWSHFYKAQVLATPKAQQSELQHIEWEVTGFAGVANNTTYLIFDPQDSVRSLRCPGRLAMIPCDIISARRLEVHWYVIRFYTDRTWEGCRSGS